MESILKDKEGEINMNMVLKYNLKEKTNQGKFLTSFGKDLSTFVAEGKNLQKEELKVSMKRRRIRESLLWRQEVIQIEIPPAFTECLLYTKYHVTCSYR